MTTEGTCEEMSAIEKARKVITDAAAILRRERGLSSAEESKKLAEKKRKDEEDDKVTSAMVMIKNALGSKVLMEKVILEICGGPETDRYKWWNKLLQGLNLYPYTVSMDPSDDIDSWGSQYPLIRYEVLLTLDENVRYIGSTLGKRGTVPPMEDPDTADALKKRSKKE